LADFPEIYFPQVCSFLGHAWEPPSLRYWEFPHHGLGGNGAPSFYLRGRKVINYTTGDDDYYKSIDGQIVGADKRWESRLAPDDVKKILDGTKSVWPRRS
jgi:hypothetical protein